MIQSAVAFGQLYVNVLSFSIQSPDIELNSPFIYQQRDKPTVKRLGKTIEMFCDRQIQLQYIFSEIIQKEQRISSIKITPEKYQLTSPKPIPRDIQIVTPNVKPGTSSYLQTNSKNYEEETEQTQPPIKLVSFKMTEEDKQLTIRTPALSRNQGCSSRFKSRLPSLVEPSKCMDLCYIGPYSQQRRQPYEVEITERQMKRMVVNKNVPTG